VLDLGSGSGLTAIAAMRAGAARVLAADIDALALAAIDLNAAANAVAVEATGEDLLVAPPDDVKRRFDVVLVGDLFYERALADRVLTFVEAASADGADILVGDPRRSYFPKERFRQVMEYAVPVTRKLEDAEIKRAAVWRLTT
jgi:predicted nicotinamide N-methyase